MCGASMVIGAPDFAFIDLTQDPRPGCPHGYEGRHFGFLVTPDMIEVQDARVGFSAIHAWM
jgi:hypothetical protein